MPNNTVTIRYKDKQGKKHSIIANSCHGEVPAYSNIFYWVFYLDRKWVAKIPESQITNKQEANKLYGRPFWNKVMDQATIKLFQKSDYFHDDENVIGYYAIGDMCSHDYILRYTDHCALHILNNKVVRATGKTLNIQLQKLFPKKQIEIHRLVRNIQVEKIEA